MGVGVRSCEDFKKSGRPLPRRGQVKAAIAAYFVRSVASVASDLKFTLKKSLSHRSSSPMSDCSSPRSERDEISPHMVTPMSGESEDEFESQGRTVGALRV
ncbi:hypothetical protein SUGI_0024760 [Cryptomeria japonica]|nr:hypothetical protein SUGI_0024760 [Cryptomeria japonica]